MFIDGTIGRDEFTAHKEKLTNEKSALADAIANFEEEGASRFKPLADFITASRQAKYTAEKEDLTELRNWHKRTGSNLIFAVRNLCGILAEESGASQADASRPNLHSSPPSFGPRGGSAARSAVHNSNTPHNSGIFSAVAESEPDFIPILPAELSAVAPAGGFFQSLGSRSDPVLHVRFPRPWSVVAQNLKIRNWRRGRDLNPR